MSNGTQSQLKHSKNLLTTAVQKALGIGDGKIRPIPPAAKENTQSGPHQKSDFQRMLKAAQKGQAEAQVYIGNAYKSGEGVAQDDEQAVYWWRKAARQGNAAAQGGLGYSYYEGKGVSQDYGQAVKWYRKAAEQGKANAQYNLGVLYSEGKGVVQDHEQAEQWYKKAAEQGCVDAQFNLGVLYYEGKDYKQAVYWHQKLAEYGNVDAQSLLGYLFETGKGVNQDYEQAEKWYKKAAEQGKADVQFNLGALYYRGEGVSKDYQQAIQWFQKAAEQGTANAQDILGCLFETGKGVDRNYEKAVQWYKKAAEQGKISAQFNLARCYDEHPDLFKEDSSFWLQKVGAGLVTLNEEQDENNELKNINFTPEDFIYLDKQGEQGNPVAKVILAQLHQVGHGVPQDLCKAYALLTEADRQDDLLAKYCLGLASMKGRGTDVDTNSARKYFNQVLNVLEQGQIFSYLKITAKNRQDKSKDYPQDIKFWLGLGTQTKLRLLDLEESKKNLENLIATLAHEFRGSFAGIRYNITHDNDAKDTEESINTMRGMLNVFGVISTGADELQQQLMQDMNGDRSLSDTLVQTLSLAVVQLLTVSSQSTIAQHYLAYAGRTRQQVAVSRKQWQDECIDLREKLQTEWEKGFVALPPVLENIQAWMHEHMGPIEVSGFASAPVRFSRYGATESVLLIVMTEMLVNAVKYYSSDTREPIVLEWRHEQAAYRFSCDNPSCRDERLIGKGSYQGHKFLSMIAEKLGGQFTAQPYENHYSAIFTLPVRLLSREEI